MKTRLAFLFIISTLWAHGVSEPAGGGGCAAGEREPASETCGELLAKARVLPPALQKLKELSDRLLAEETAPNVRRFNNRVEIEGDQGKITIGLLNASRTLEFMTAAEAAVREGSISKIDAGIVVGPKVLPMLVRLKERAPVGHKMEIYGKITGEQIASSMRENLVTRRTNSINGKTEGFTLEEAQALRAAQLKEFTQAEVDSVERAAHKLGLFEACKEYFSKVSLDGCGTLKFHVGTDGSKSFKPVHEGPVTEYGPYIGPAGTHR